MFLKSRYLFFVWTILVSTLLLSATSKAETIQYIYDDLGRLEAELHGDGTAKEYWYDEVGNRTFKSVANTTITATAGSGGNISPSGLVWVRYAEDQTFTVTPDTNYHIVNVMVDGISQGALTSYTFSGVRTIHTISAAFAANSASYTLTVINSSPGPIVSSDSKINCGTDCSEVYYAGTVVVLSPTPDPDYAFSGGGCSGGGPCTVTMNSNANVPFTMLPPVADFSASPVTGSAPLLVTFSDLSSHLPASWTWNFGDGETGALKNPPHIYRAAGTYSVTLTATNAGGSGAQTKTEYITVNPCSNLPVRISGATPAYYATLQGAYNASANLDTIQSQAVSLTEDLNISANRSIVFRGGYDCSYDVITGKTIINGNVVISNGSNTIENFSIEGGGGGEGQSPFLPDNPYLLEPSLPEHPTSTPEFYE